MNKMQVNQQLLNDNINGIMTQLGYFDQSHMIHEFKRYSNRTPGQYVTELCETGYHNRLIILE